MKTKIIDAKVEFQHQPFLKPLRISSGAITEITEARAEVVVSVNGKEAVGHGSIYLSDLWAWPEPSLNHQERDAILRELCEQIASNLWGHCGSEAMHPLELGLRLHESVCHKGADGGPSILAKVMCAIQRAIQITFAVQVCLRITARTSTPLRSRLTRKQL